MALRERLSAEKTDSQKAADAAAAGRSLTGFSGRHTEMAADQQMFGAPPEPVAVPEDTPRPPPARERKPFGASEQVLAYPPRAGYRRYWFNDLPGRIQRALEAGYTHVLDERGQNVSRITDRTDRGGRASYLMEIPMEFYEEDMQAQQDELARRLNDIRNGRKGADVTVDNGYVPQQGITIRRG